MPTADARDYVQKLIDALNHREPLTRVRAARLLGKIGDGRATAPLLSALHRQRDDPEFLATAAEALGALHEDIAVPSLIGLGRSSYLKARLAAVEALTVWLPRRDVAEALRSACRDPNKVVRVAAVRALAGRSDVDERSRR